MFTRDGPVLFQFQNEMKPFHWLEMTLVPKLTIEWLHFVSEQCGTVTCERGLKLSSLTIQLLYFQDYYDRARVAGRDIPMNLVLFPQYCQHIVAAARVLRQTGGHLLMIGIGGTGKKSVIQLASYMQFCEFYQPTVSKNYCINDFKEDIKKVLLKAGVEGTKMTFFLNDRNIIQVSIL